MRYIGSKKKLVNFIEDTVKEYCGKDLKDKVFCDLFAGTGSVGKHFSGKVKYIIANDFEAYSKLINEVAFYGYDQKVVKTIVDHFNAMEGTTDSPIYDAYVEGGAMGRMYFEKNNGMKICAARKHLEEISYLIGHNEYNAALASIVEAADKVANTAATYGAFMKDKEKHKACLEPIVFELPETVVPEDRGYEANFVFGVDANFLIPKISGDILYLDPPYNTRQYGSNYHVLNGIVTLDIQDKDSSTGVPKNYNRSNYCSKRTAKDSLDKLIRDAQFEWVFLSYNNEGIMSFDDIVEVFKKYGTYRVECQEYKRYKADNNRNQKADKTYEYIHVLHKGVFPAAEQEDIVDPASKPMELRREAEVKKKIAEWDDLAFQIDDVSFGDEDEEESFAPKVEENFVVSPMNYMGGKKKLLSAIKKCFPKDIDFFFDLFCGGATVGINSGAKTILFNDSLKPLIDMYYYMSCHSVEDCLSYIDSTIEKWGLVQGEEGKDAFYKFRDEHYNSTPSEERHPLDLFILMAFSFNNQIRFAVKKDWKFNVPFGKNRSSFNGKMRENLIGFINALHENNCKFVSRDFRHAPYFEDMFVYADPPYLISQATYNDGWDEECEKDLLSKLEKWDKYHGIKFALSNVLENKGKENTILKNWIEENGYNVIHLNNSYSNSYYNRKERESKTDEVLITNYKLEGNV